MYKKHFSLISLALILLALPLLAWAALWANTRQARAQAIDTHPEAVWKLVRQLGQYDFTVDIAQTTVPLPKVENIGRESKTQRLYMEGSNNLPDQRMNLSLWGLQGGSLLDPQTAIEVKVEGDQAFTRHGPGEWQPAENFTGFFAPEGDFLAFLTAAGEIADQGEETRAGVTFRRYTFSIDGPAFAAYMRDQIEAQMTARGELPPGISLDLPQVYAGMTGSGELWVLANGLPLRQVLNLNFPDGEDTRTEAAVTVDFSNFPEQTAAAGFDFSAILAALQNAAPGAALFLLAVGLSLALALNSHSKKLRAAVTITFIISMVFSPLLQSAQAAAFYDQQVERAAAPSDPQSEMQKALQSVQEAPAYGPTAADLARIQGDTHADSDQDGFSDVQETYLGSQPFDAASLPAELPAADDGTDSDGDGLSDYEEALLGTSSSTEDQDYDGVADGVDTDGDTITDTLEVQGFTDNGQTYYSNPLELDSNNDGIEDGSEWNKPGTHPTWDTDGDGAPDLFDTDNDNDGVPDRQDLSPFAASSETFGQDDPLRLVLNGLTPGRPTYVEFQLRPTDPDHLWYAFNVFDWPFDRKAQVQDEDGKTFFDLCVQQGGTNCAANPDDNGDLRLVPMLEITLDGGDSVANLPDPNELEDTYGVIVRPLNNESGAGQQMLAYVPLQLVTESQSDNHIAFYGKMMYDPAAAWGNAQSVRLVWLVQMMNDNTDDGDNGVVDNAVQVIHTYPDEWALTGLNVRENGPNERAVLYEDPAVDTDLTDDSALYQLVNGLGSSFMVSRDCEAVVSGQCRGDGLQDLYIASGPGNTTFAERFDRDQNAGISDLARWGIPNTLQVETRRYTHLDQAIGDTAQVTNRDILNHFTDHWSETAPITPTLLYVHQDSFRVGNLDLAGESSVAQWSGSQLTLDFAADGGVPLLTTRGFNWAPFRYDAVLDAWKSYAIEDYWNDLSARYADANPTDPEDVRGDVSRGKVMILQFFYLSLYAGVAQVIQAAGVSLTDQMPRLPDVDIRDEISTFNGPKGVAVFAVNTIVLARIQNKFVVWQYLGRLNGTQFIKLKELGTTDIVRKVVGTFSNLKANAVTAAGITIAVVAGVTGILLKFFAADAARFFGTSEQVISGVGTLFISLALLIATVVAPIKAVMGAMSIVSAASGISKPAALLSVLGGRSELIGITRKASVVGLIISIGVIVGAFIYTWVTQDVKFGSITANTLIADAVSGIIIAVVLFAIALSTVGAIAVAIVGLVDLIFLGLCELGVDALCFSIIGGWVEGLARLIYSGDIAIDTERDDLVTFRGMNGNLVNPGLGLQVGNSMLITATIRTRIYQKPPSSGYSTAYASAGKIFSSDNLRAATFNYHLGKTYISISASRNEHPSAWQGVQRYGYVDHSLYGRSWYHTGYKDDTKYSGAIPLTAGVNEALELRFKAAMAIPSYECWVYVCDTNNVEKADYAKFMGEDLVYDIFPLNLDGFVNVGSWGFGPQRDLDGDGLVSAVVFHGSDENDEEWDMDGDGLNDAAELRAGSSNYRADSDNDGLHDRDEVILGTNPMRADSDRDGLNDKAELDGWLFEYAPGQFTRVFSEPNNTDSDLDGLSDLLEKNLGAPYHPRVENPRPVALYAETSDGDDFLRPGQGFIYTTTVRNEVTEAWWASGSLVITAPVVLGGQSFASNFVLGSGQASVQARNLSVQANAGSQSAPVDHNVRARLDQNPNGGGSLGTVSYLSALPLTVDNDRPTSGVTGSGFVAAGGTRILGIAASDPTSTVSRVQVRVQNGDWQDATRDGEFWLFTWDVPETEGEYVIFTRASDAVGWDQAPEAASSVYVDAHAPASAAELTENQILAAQRNSANRWVLPLTGTASDPTFGQPASGVESVEVQLSPNGDGWQPATVITTTNPNTWSLDYVLPALDQAQAVQVTPSGYYTVEVRARDRAGNLTADADILQVHIGIDNDAPAASITGLETVAVLAPSLDETITIGGFVTETGIVQAGVGGLEIALVPAEVVPSLDDRTLALPLNEPPQAVVFEDVSGLEHPFFCLPEQCPSSGAPGRFDAAVSFDGTDQYLDPLQLALPLTDFTTSLWFNTTCPNCGLFSADHGNLGAQGHDRELYLDAGKVCANLLGPTSTYESICSIENSFADGQWHHVAHSVGAGGQVLIVDGVQRVRGFLAASSFSAQSGANLGFALAAGHDYFSGSLDEFVIYNTALGEAEAATLFQAWQPAVVENPGAPISAWRYELPAGVEGFYQIDLRPTDMLGNRNDRRQDWRQWRGEIDTAYPQVSIQVAYSGQGESAQTHYSGTATDLNLVEDGFVSPCDPQTIERGDYTSPWWAQWSNATPRLNRFTFSCSVPGNQTDNVHVRACDAFGRCAAAQPDQFRLFYTAKNYNPGDARILSLSTFDGSDERQLINGLGGVPVALALDIPGGKMYWTENVNHPASASIHRANLDGSEPESLITGISAGTLGPKTLSLALDRAGGKMYWTVGRGVFRANLDGSGIEQLFSLPDQNHVAGVIALDLEAGTMYWTGGYAYGPNYDTGTVWRANLNGSNAQALFPNVPRMTALAFDPAERKLYWMADNIIRRADPDGSNVEDVVTGVNEFFRTGLAVAPYGERIYWIENDLIQQAEAFGAPKTLRKTLIFAPVYDPWTLAIGRIPAFTTTQVDLSIDKSEPVSEIAVQGSTTQYSLIARNASFLDAHDVTVEDVLPAGLSLASAQPPEANCSESGGTVTCDLGDFASAETLTITLTLNVAPGTSGFLSNSASIASREQDFNTTNNTVTVNHTLAVAAATATPPASARYAYVGGWASVVRVRLDEPGGSEIIVPYDAIGTQLYFPIEGVAVDHINPKIYWPNPYGAKIQRANLDGSGVEDFITGVEQPTFITIHAAAGHIYWLSDYGHTLERANLDGSGRETLLTSLAARSLAIDAVRGKLYWIAATGKIQRADLDGQNIETLVENVFGAVELALDPYGSKLYWIEADPFRIRRANPDGSQIETILEGFAARPVGILLDASAGKLYWFESDTLRRANLDGSGVEDVAAGLPNIGAYGPNDPMNLVYLGIPTITPSPTTTPSPTFTLTPTETPTFDPGASDTPTPTPSNTPTALPTPTPGGPAAAERLFWSDVGTFLRRAPASGCPDGACVELLLSRPANAATDLVVDSGNGFIYWTDPASDSILRSRLDGSNVTTILSGLNDPHGLAFDPQEAQLYWSEPSLGLILHVNADGSNPDIFLSGLNTPTWLALDTFHNRLYWYENRALFEQQIGQANLDGSGVQAAVVDPVIDFPYYFLEFVTALEVDPEHGWLFWTDSGGSQPGTDFPYGRVNRFDLACAQAGGGDGAKSACFATIVQEDLVYPFGLGLDPNAITLYWASYTWDEITHLPVNYTMKSARMDGTISGYPITNLIDLPDVIPAAVDVQYPLACQPAADSFEPDDLFGQAVTVTLDAPSAGHTFHTSTDADWLAFSAEEGQRYILRSGLSGTDVDTRLELYDTDGATPLLTNDNAHPGVAYSEITFDPAASGRYFLRLTDVNGAASCESVYSVSLALGAFDPLPTPEPGPAPDFSAPLIDSAVLEPAGGSVLNSLGQVTVSGGAYARDSLQTLDVRVDGSLLFSDSWANGVMTDTAWSNPWTPPAEGIYTLEAVASDWAGRVQTETHPITVTVDTALPTISLAPTVYTTTHILPGSSQIALGGLAGDTLGVQRVEVNADNEGWQGASFDAGNWTYPWLAGNLDNVTIPVVAQVTDLAGKTSLVNQNITVDVVAPLPDGVHLYRQAGPGLQEIFPGETVYEANATLVITWTAATDASGLQAYRAGWTTSPTPPIDQLASVAPASALQHSQAVGEAQVLYAHVVSTDSRGNRTWLTFGPVYVDGPTTPDLTSFTPAGLEPDPYGAWRGSGSTQIGADRESSKAGQGQIQRFYATWDAANLRLAWLGADWDNDGDLFIYFDTGSGGATMLFNPFPPSTPPHEGGEGEIGLPGGLSANALIWVEDNTSASLYTWNGSDWAFAAALTADQFRFSASALTPAPLTPNFLITDLSLPFSLLGVNPANPLRLVAVASDEDQLSLWASAPDKNPLNSQRVVSPLAQGRNLSDFALNVAYQWPSLGAGVQPNLGRFADSDLQLAIQPDPAGVAVGWLESDLLDLLAPATRLDADNDGVLDVALPLDDNAYPLYDGQEIDYTITYTNSGTQAARGVAVSVHAYGALTLPGSTLTIDLGDIPAGATGRYTFQASVDASLNSHSAELVATVEDGIHGEYDWQWVQHDLDVQAPTDLQITAPVDFIRPYTQTIYGLVSDASGVPDIELEIDPLPSPARGGAGGEFLAPTELMQCSDATPLDGHWACEWNAGSTLGITSFRLRARARDSFGNPSDWTNWITLAVDNTPPVVTLDTAIEGALADGFLSADEARITGLVTDNLRAARLVACTQGLPCTPYFVSPGNTPVGAWSLHFPVDDLDGVEQTLTLVGYDAVDNASAALERTFVVDSVAPMITATQLVTEMPTNSQRSLLSGRVTDGGGVANLSLRIQSPGGQVTYQAITPSGSSWQVSTQFGQPGVYTLSVEAYDLAGNYRASPSFAVLVSGPNQIYLPLVYKNTNPSTTRTTPGAIIASPSVQTSNAPTLPTSRTGRRNGR